MNTKDIKARLDALAESLTKASAPLEVGELIGLCRGLLLAVDNLHAAASVPIVIGSPEAVSWNYVLRDINAARDVSYFCGAVHIYDNDDGTLAAAIDFEGPWGSKEVSSHFSTAQHAVLAAAALQQRLRSPYGASPVIIVEPVSTKVIR